MAERCSHPAPARRAETICMCCCKHFPRSIPASVLRHPLLVLQHAYSSAGRQAESRRQASPSGLARDRGNEEGRAQGGARKKPEKTGGGHPKLGSTGHTDGQRGAGRPQATWSCNARWCVWVCGCVCVGGGGDGAGRGGTKRGAWGRGSHQGCAQRGCWDADWVPTGGSSWGNAPLGDSAVRVAAGWGCRALLSRAHACNFSFS